MEPNAYLSLFTVGHSNHDEKAFLDLLLRHQIQVLVDVRSQPYSRYAPHFNSAPLGHLLAVEAIEYVAMGPQLGGRPEEAECYDEEGHVLYRRLAETPRFLEGIGQLGKHMDRGRVAMMCSEEDPSICHRHLLIARVLSQRDLKMGDVKIHHIRGDGRVQSEEDVRSSARGGDARQSMLFAELEQDSWRSVRSVLRKAVQPKSSES